MTNPETSSEMAPDSAPMFYVDDLAAATGQSRRMVLRNVKLYEQISGERIARVMRRNFLTPQLTREQFDRLVKVGTAEDSYSYAERIRALITGNPLESSAPVLGGNATLDTSRLEAQVARIENQLSQLPLAKDTNTKKLEAEVVELKTQLAQLSTQVNNLQELVLRIPAELTKSLLESPDVVG